MLNYKYTSIDLFSGPGGLTTGLKIAGIKPLIAVETNNETVETYVANHNADVLHLDLFLEGKLPNMNEFFLPNTKSLLIHGDVRKISNQLIKNILRERFLTDKVDIVTGGPPCESFSIAGKRLPDDERDYLYLHLSRIAKSTDASLLLFENVKGLLSKKIQNGYGTVFSKICEEFEKNDSNTGVSFRLASSHKQDILLNCADYGVPQTRERIFLVGINNKYNEVYFNYPAKTNGPGFPIQYVTVRQALSHLPKIDVLEKAERYELMESEIDRIQEPELKKFLEFIRGIKPVLPSEQIVDSKNLDSHKASKHYENTIKRMSLIFPGESMKSAAVRLIKEGKTDLRNKYFPKKPFGARYRRLRSDLPSFTVTSHSFDEMIHPELNRALTPREVARLQTFPDWYVFKGPYVIFHSAPEQDRYEQIGDAVPPLMGFRLGEEIINTLRRIAQIE